MRTQGLRRAIGTSVPCVLFLLLVFVFSGCSNNDQVITNLAGDWHSEVSVTSCEPADACQTAGFVQGASLFADLTLSQVRSDLTGTYTYEGAQISVPVSGRVGGGEVALNGVTTVTVGSVTVNFSGTLSGGTMPATITHQITLRNGRAANIAVAGTFTR